MEKLIFELSVCKWWQFKKKKNLKAQIAISFIGLIKQIQVDTADNFKCNYKMMPLSFQRNIRQ
jgi:hypothetical protein